ncbi:hypothetical protein Jiend_44100 [Micromonospora endophytica]|nr:hypothetical protein Jiend_44100 [Micromonospora endophytica]
MITLTWTEPGSTDHYFNLRGSAVTGTWMWTVRRQTTPDPGGLIDKGAQDKRARTVPLIEEVRLIVANCPNAV